VLRSSLREPISIGSTWSAKTRRLSRTSQTGFNCNRPRAPADQNPEPPTPPSHRETPEIPQIEKRVTIPAPAAAAGKQGERRRARGSPVPNRPRPLRWSRVKGRDPLAADWPGAGGLGERGAVAERGRGEDALSFLLWVWGKKKSGRRGWL